MAFCITNDEEKEALRRSKLIDRQLQQEKKNLRQEIKILLLGAGESGKSTFIKQMRIIHGEDFSESDRLEFRPIIYHNILKGCKILVEARRRLQIPLENSKNERNGQVISSYHREGDLSDEDFHVYVEALTSLHKDAGVQATFKRSNEFQLGDSVPYFMKHLERVGALGYIPSKEDVLNARKATRGIQEYVIDIKGVPFRFVDVGGQRSQRQKWFQCFDEVTSILFLVSSSAFDQTILEDRVTNRLVESVNIFDTIVNNRCFRSVSVILFFNKTDLLIDKIKTKNIGDYFTDFQGDGHRLEDVQGYMVSMFNHVRHDTTLELYRHFTTAIDTRNIKVVFNVVKDTILTRHIQDIMQL